MGSVGSSRGLSTLSDYAGMSGTVRRFDYYLSRVCDLKKLTESSHYVSGDYGSLYSFVPMPVEPL